MKLLRNLLLFMTLGMLILPFIQSRYRLIKEPDLMGFFNLAGKPDLEKFSLSSWTTANFQDEVQKGIEDHVGFRNSLIRLRNQYDYSFFGRTNNSRFLFGHKNIVFDQDDILEYTGNLFIGSL